MGLEILMMTARWYVLNKAVSAARLATPVASSQAALWLLALPAVLENHPKVESTTLDRQKVTDILHLDWSSLRERVLDNLVHLHRA